VAQRLESPPKIVNGKAMVAKWLHLEELGGDPWVLPIWTVVSAAVAAGKVPAISKELSEMGVHVSTRFNVIPRIINRLNDEISDIYKTARTHKPGHVFTEKSKGKALRVDNDLKYHIIADIDAFLFEVNACAELMHRFFQLLHGHAGSPVADADLTKKISGALKKHGVAADWFCMLDRNRNFATHKGTPYLSIDVTNDGAYELLIMKENLTRFDESKKYFRYSELVAIAKGFSAAKEALQKCLIDLFK